MAFGLASSIASDIFYESLLPAPDTAGRKRGRASKDACDYLVIPIIIFCTAIIVFSLYAFVFEPLGELAGYAKRTFGAVNFAVDSIESRVRHSAVGDFWNWWSPVPEEHQPKYDDYRPSSWRQMGTYVPIIGFITLLLIATHIVLRALYIWGGTASRSPPSAKPTKTEENSVSAERHCCTDNPRANATGRAGGHW